MRKSKASLRNQKENYKQIEEINESNYKLKKFNLIFKIQLIK